MEFEIVEGIVAQSCQQEWGSQLGETAPRWRIRSVPEPHTALHFPECEDFLRAPD